MVLWDLTGIGKAAVGVPSVRLVPRYAQHLADPVYSAAFSSGIAHPTPMQQGSRTVTDIGHVATRPVEARQHQDVDCALLSVPAPIVDRRAVVVGEVGPHAVTSRLREATQSVRTFRPRHTGPPRTPSRRHHRISHCNVLLLLKRLLAGP